MIRIARKHVTGLLALAISACAGELPDATDAGSKSSGATKTSTTAANGKADAGSQDREAGKSAGGAAAAGSSAARGTAGASGSAARANAGAGAKAGAGASSGAGPKAGAPASPPVTPRTRAPASQPPGKECAADQLYEPNDTPGDPCWIQPNQKIVSELAAKDVDDYFSIDVEKGITYTLDISTSGSYNRELTLTIGDKVESLVTGHLSPGVTHPEFTPSASGRALFHINGTAQYHFAIWDDLVTRDSSLEPNNSAPSAADIQVGEVISQQLSSPDDDVDCYRFDVTADVTYTLDLTAAQNVNRVVLMIVDGARDDALTDGRTIGTTHPEFTPRATGKAVLVLYNGGSYHFQILAPDLPQDPITYEPNNSPSTATPIEVGTKVLSELGAIPDDDIDYFSVPVKANTTYVLHLESDRNIYRSAVLMGAPILAEARAAPGTNDPMFTTRGSDGLMILKFQGPANYKFDVSEQ